MNRRKYISAGFGLGLGFSLYSNNDSKLNVSATINDANAFIINDYIENININFENINEKSLMLETIYKAKFENEDSFKNIKSESRDISNTSDNFEYSTSIDILTNSEFEYKDFLPEESFNSRIRKIDFKLIFQLSNGIDKTIRDSFNINIEIPEIKATGGYKFNYTDSKDNEYFVHVFESVDNHTLEFEDYNEDDKMDILVVAGGGGGGSHRGGGGGAGGLIFKENVDITQDVYNLTVGDGGEGADIGSDNFGSNGNDSIFDSLYTAIGGGGGAPFSESGLDGGSGGGSGTESQIEDGGNGIAEQGNNGGGANENSNRSGLAGGGGGAGSRGEHGLSSEKEIDNYGDGGIGKDLSDIFGSSVGDGGWFAGGGGGGLEGRTDISNGSTGDVAEGGKGGGGNSGMLDGSDSGGDGQTTQKGDGKDGLPNTGGGGGGGNYDKRRGGNGGSGVIIVRYLIN